MTQDKPLEGVTEKGQDLQDGQDPTLVAFIF